MFYDDKTFYYRPRISRYLIKRIVLSSLDKCSSIKFYLNISMWDLVLNSLLQRIQWCNRILISMLGLAVMTYFTWKNIACVLMSLILDFMHATFCLVGCACAGCGPDRYVGQMQLLVSVRIYRLPNFGQRLVVPVSAPQTPRGN